VVVDRLTSRIAAKRAYTDSVETACSSAVGLSVLDFVDKPDDDPERERTFQRAPRCLDDDLSFEELEPRSFSFNSPYGACPTCTASAPGMEVDPELVVPTTSCPCAPARSPLGRGPVGRLLRRLLVALAETLDFDVDAPWRTLPERARRPSCTASTTRSTSSTATGTGRERSYYTGFEGAIPFVSGGTPRPTRVEPRALRGLHARGALPDVQGLRLKPEVLAVTLADRSIAESAGLPPSARPTCSCATSTSPTGSARSRSAW
jgi:excinuclease ABC subunit A